MTVYTGRTFQTCALRVWGVWVSMRDFHSATVRCNRDLPPGLIKIRLGIAQPGKPQLALSEPRAN
jgi:hypothetical protein